MADSGCKLLAQILGAVVEIDGKCVPVYGKVVIIGPDRHSVEEGFEIVNFNFHVNGNMPVAPSPRALQGPVMDKSGNLLV